MIILLSPAKTLDFSPVDQEQLSTPRLLTQSRKLVRVLKEKSIGDLQELMGISEKLAEVNVTRFKKFKTPFTAQNAKPAGLAFKGDVYLGLEADSFDADDLDFAQHRLRILSGLYGVLRPLDLMQAYRLEMGTRLAQNGTSNLYEFWGDRITKVLNKDLKENGGELFLNLASQEYFKAVQPDKLRGRLLNIHFKEARNGKYKVIAFNAKKARGRMAHLIIKERISQVEALKELVVNDYIFNPSLSTENDWVFTID